MGVWGDEEFIRHFSMGKNIYAENELAYLHKFG